MRLLIITILVIVFMGAFLIANSKGLSLTKVSDVKVIVEETFSWVKTLGNNFKNIVGLTISQEWAPDTEDGEENKDQGPEEKDGEES